MPHGLPRRSQWHRAEVLSLPPRAKNGCGQTPPINFGSYGSPAKRFLSCLGIARCAVSLPSPSLPRCIFYLYFAHPHPSLLLAAGPLRPLSSQSTREAEPSVLCGVLQVLAVARDTFLSTLPRLLLFALPLLLLLRLVLLHLLHLLPTCKIRAVPAAAAREQLASSY